MPVDTVHPQYLEYITKWSRARDVIGGEDRVKCQGIVYLPKLTEQTDDDYHAYKQRAQFFNATARTIDGFSGMLFRKDPKIEVPKNLDDFTNDCTLSGRSLQAFIKDIANDVIGVGRVGTLIDWSKDEARPYCVSYQAEQIINWRMVRAQGRVVLGLIVLKENVYASDAAEDAIDQTQEQQREYAAVASTAKGTGTGKEPENKYDDYNPKMVEQIRVFRLNNYNGEPFVEVEIFRKQGDREWKSTFKESLQRLGKPLPEIPFVFHSPNGKYPEVEGGPMEDIIQTNLSHYRSSADLEHGRHFTGLPTAWATGFDTTSKLYIGGSAAWVTPVVGGAVGYLEFTGQGLKALETALEQKEHHMAVLGARMLEVQIKGAEAAETLKLRHAGESSVLMNISKSLDESLETILKWALWWISPATIALSDLEEQVSVDLNTDFVALKLAPQEITALVMAWTNRGISQDTLLYALKQGEVIPPDRTTEEEAALILSETPPATGATLPLDKTVPPKE